MIPRWVVDAIKPDSTNDDLRALAAESDTDYSELWKIRRRKVVNFQHSVDRSSRYYRNRERW